MTLRDWLREAQGRLPHLARFDLELLLVERLQMGRAHLLAHLGDALPDEVAAQLATDEAQLAARVPLQYVIGAAWFRGERYAVTPAVLIPRFDTEYLVEAMLARVTETEAAVLDLCTGSGIVAISLALAREDWQLSASDISAEALAVARGNGAQLGATVEWREGDLFAPWEGRRFDAIVANPPYISAEEYVTLSPEVQREPLLALVAEDDGLAFYRRLATEAADHLLPGGWLGVEIGWQQGAAVQQLFKEHGFEEVACLPDGQGLDRVVVAQLL